LLPPEEKRMMEDPTEFARRVDELGRQGMTQDQIVQAVGLTKSKVRWRLMLAGYVWVSENRVREGRTGKRLEDVIEEKAQPAERASPPAAAARSKASKPRTMEQAA
jgi:hypothetical protein